MGRILRRPAARRDLVAIHRYIAREAPMRAGPFLERIGEKLVLLSDNPCLGAAKLPSRPAVRVFPVGAYLIVYAPLAEGDGIELIRVVHGARDWTRLLSES